MKTLVIVNKKGYRQDLVYYNFSILKKLVKTARQLGCQYRLEETTE